MRSQSISIWAFDFDGTISDLVPERDAAAIDPECHSLLSRLARDPNQVVAVISSRRLDDLINRINIKGIILAGSSGLEWVIPGDHRLGPDARAMERLESERKRLLPSLQRIASIPGLELEDKMWSAALHFRNADLNAREAAGKELGSLQMTHGVAVHYGPGVAEVQFLAEVSKEIAVKTLVRLNKSAYEAGSILYAGDDQNDAQAMKWVLSQKGIVYVVGGRIKIAHSRSADSPADLARRIRVDYLSQVSYNHKDG